MKAYFSENKIVAGNDFLETSENHVITRCSKTELDAVCQLGSQMTLSSGSQTTHHGFSAITYETKTLG